MRLCARTNKLEKVVPGYYGVGGAPPGLLQQGSYLSRATIEPLRKGGYSILSVAADSYRRYWIFRSQVGCPESRRNLASWARWLAAPRLGPTVDPAHSITGMPLPQGCPQQATPFRLSPPPAVPAPLTLEELQRQIAELTVRHTKDVADLANRNKDLELELLREREVT